MDKVSEVRLFVDRLDFVTEMFEKILGYEKVSNSLKVMVNMKMDCGTIIVFYDSRNVYKEGDKILKLIINEEKIEKLRKFLDLKGEKFYFKEKHEFGVSKVLNWQMDNGSMIDFSSEE